MRRIDDKNGGGESLAGHSPSAVSGPPGPTSVIPFVRRAVPPPRIGSAGDVEPPSTSPFVSLGQATQAVVLKVANDMIRLKVMAAGPAWEDEDRQP